MQNIEQRFTPISYANTSKTTFVVPFPDYVKTSEIGIDLNSLGNLLRIGGISHLRVEGQTDGETSRYTPTIVGFDTQGNAYAGKKGEKTTVPEFTTLIEKANQNLNDYQFRSHAATWQNAVINLNINEIAEKIRQENRWDRGVYSTQAWSYHLDNALKKGVSNIGVRHLTMGLNKHGWSAVVFQYGMMCSYEATTGQPFLEGMILRIPFTSIFLNAWEFFWFGSGKDGFRWSIFYGPQLDRALALKLLTLRTKLVKAISPESQNNLKTPLLSRSA